MYEKFSSIINELNTDRDMFKTISKNAIEYSKKSFSLNKFKLSYIKLLVISNPKPH